MSGVPYDLVVIGGGSGGSATAKRAAGYGAKVCLIERGSTRDEQGNRVGAGVGGTCVNVGCVPKKLMFNAALHRENMVGAVSLSEGLGYTVAEDAGKLDWHKLKTRRDAEVSRLNVNYLAGWEKAGVEVIMGVASFQSASEVAITLNDGGSRVVTGKHVLIACGGKPSVPDVPGKELTITSDGFFDLETQPKKIAVVGAGYIAVELAGILHALGSSTHLLFRQDTVLRSFDPYIVGTLMDSMKAHGPHLHANTTVKLLAKEADGTTSIHTKDGSKLTGFDVVLTAIGRTPVTKTLNLEAAGVKTDKRGFIIVDEFENTTADGVVALGDATTTGYELTPVAIAAGRRLADRLFGGEPRAKIEYSDIATVVFSHPPIGTIGLTEPEAIAQFGKDQVRVKQARFASMLYTFNAAEGKVKTALKLVLVGEKEKVVGLHCIGPFSDEMLQGFAVAIKMGATRSDFDASVAIHPTVAEEMVTMGGWGQDKDGRPRLRPSPKPEAPPPKSDRLMLGVALGVGITSVAWLMTSKL